jgi:DNA polymerase-3 subunit epsilon
MDFEIRFNSDDNHKKIRIKGENLIALPDAYTVIDIETTGLDQRYDQIIEIGAVKVVNNSITDTFESLVQPDPSQVLGDNDEWQTEYVDEFITELTGITNEMLESAPPPEEILPKFIAFIENDTLLGHNIHFDINFLYDLLLETIDHRLNNNFVDLLRLSRKVYPHFENHKLATLASLLGVKEVKGHRALSDCRITHECFQELVHNVHINNIDLDTLWKSRSKSRPGYIRALDLRELKPEGFTVNEDHPIYDKYCTFTGKLERMDRRTAAQIVVNIGGKCLNSVTKETNFLILGNFDYCSSIKDGKSSKFKRAEELMLKGQDLKILSEDIFYDLITSY